MSLRLERQEETRRRLIDAGLKVFMNEGYANTSTQALVEACGLTRGALYHHFPSGKEGLFKAVHRKLQNDLMSRLELGPIDGAAPLRAHLSAYFEAAIEPAYRQIVLIDGPAIMSFDEWNEGELDLGLTLIGRILALSSVNEDLLALDQDLLAEILFAAFGQAALALVRHDDIDATKSRLLDVFDVLLARGNPTGPSSGR